MFCINCGHKLEQGSRFCLQCGHPVSNASQNQAEQLRPQAPSQQPSQPQPQPPINSASHLVQDPNMDPNAMTPDRIALINYRNEVNSIHTVALVSLILSFVWIGCILVCINAGNFGRLPKQVMLYTKEDWAFYEQTQSKLRSALVLHVIACAIDLITTILCVALFVMLFL